MRHHKSSHPSPIPAARPVLSGEQLGRELATAVVLFHEAVASRLGLTATEWRCLALLGQHGPSTAGRLAALSGFTTGAITGIVDRLERAGYARRKYNPDDRRSVIICPMKSAALGKKVGPIFASLGAAMYKIAGGYTPKELALITRYLLETIQVLRAETAKVSRRKP